MSVGHLQICCRRRHHRSGPLHESAGCGDPGGSDLIRVGHDLAPHDPTATFTAALANASEGNFDDSLAEFRNAIKLGRPIRSALAVYLGPQIDRPDLAFELAADNSSALLELASLLDGLGNRTEEAQRARDEARRILTAQAARPEAEPHILAWLAAQLFRENKYTESADHYRRALEKDYSNVEWRFARAQALVKVGKFRDALHETEICLRLRPAHAAARKLKEELALMPGMSGP